MVPGSLQPGRQPDGNSILIDAPDGLILVDTGRHPEHQQAILAAASARGKPIAAIFNTHWHLDHSGGNAEISAAFPGIPIYASTAIDAALTGFLAKSRADAAAYVASGEATPQVKADIALDMAAMDDPATLRPTRPVTASGRMKVAGRTLDVRLAPFAATEGDVWIHDPANRTVIAGDLVVASVPFFDTACPEGWRKALDGIAAVRFQTVIPGHGEPMSRAAFLTWRRAFNALLDCAASDAPKTACIAGWKRDAAAFIPAGDTRVERLLGYYLDSRLRAAPEERTRYCKPS